ncbi:MAG: phosphopentomutase [Verrucomicrobiota bacterium]
MRALLLVLDSVGIGHATDADQYRDAGANTLGHIFARVPGLALPNLFSLGLGQLLARDKELPPTCGKMQPSSAGKDTTTGHWELAGVILDQPFAVYETFPEELVRAIEFEAAVKFIGNYARSGTTVLDELGAEHLRSGHPILYTSADSVLQIAAHEEVIAINRLYEICRIARSHVDRFQIGRVIARPFRGEVGNFERTSRRHDFSMTPPRTILNALSENDIPVIGVGKISDIFAGAGITESFPTTDNEDGMRRLDAIWHKLESGLVFANLVDFDMLYGHRRDAQGYARALQTFDHWFGTFFANILPNDLVIITADHGNDPTFRGTDHTREQVPLFVLPSHARQHLGTRETFADVAATLAQFFQLPAPWPVGASFLH